MGPGYNFPRGHTHRSRRGQGDKTVVVVGAAAANYCIRKWQAGKIEAAVDDDETAPCHLYALELVPGTGAGVELAELLVVVVVELGLFELVILPVEPL